MSKESPKPSYFPASNKSAATNPRYGLRRLADRKKEHDRRQKLFDRVVLHFAAQEGPSWHEREPGVMDTCYIQIGLDGRRSALGLFLDASKVHEAESMQVRQICEKRADLFDPDERPNFRDWELLNQLEICHDFCQNLRELRLELRRVAELFRLRPHKVPQIEAWKTPTPAQQSLLGGLDDR